MDMAPNEVIRRVGGLEERVGAVAMTAGVIRRVGGLEGHERTARSAGKVIRRVGGLEGWLALQAYL